MDIVNPLKFLIGSVLSTAVGIYKLAEKAKANKKQCHRIGERVKALERVVNSIDSIEAAQLSAEVTKTLEELSTVLNSTFGLIEKFTSSNWMKRLYKTSSHAGEFQMVNDRLSDSFQNLTIALQLKQGSDMGKLLKEAFTREEDEKDRKEDEKELNRSEKRHFGITSSSSYLNDFHVLEHLGNFEKFGKSCYMCMTKASLYKSFITVNILVNCREIKSDFKKEVETMKRFESPNILRMFGICILDEDTPNTKYLIIMEYCEKGSLREVLSSERDLSWSRKVKLRSQGSEAKASRDYSMATLPHFSGCSSFQLGGLELAQTETSLRNATVNKRKDKDISSLCYSSPQMLSEGMRHYCKKCEIYSLGIVMWEIATQRKPFSGGTLHVKVAEEHYREPVPRQCPESLEELIDACRGHHCVQRPPAGAAVTVSTLILGWRALPIHFFLGVPMFSL
uniref:Protein kinase domain-containing protein n=1 Tax=Xiphophorus couchianus TaxID=32473 RepID=A0A3B5L451_9TELE